MKRNNKTARRQETATGQKAAGSSLVQKCSVCVGIKARPLAPSRLRRLNPGNQKSERVAKIKINLQIKQKWCATLLSPFLYFWLDVTLSFRRRERAKQIGVRCAPAALNAQLKNAHGDPPQRLSDEKLLMWKGKGDSALLRSGWNSLPANGGKSWSILSFKSLLYLIKCS